MTRIEFTDGEQALMSLALLALQNADQETVMGLTFLAPLKVRDEYRERIQAAMSLSQKLQAATEQ